mgnify:CR=1 FL=1
MISYRGSAERKSLKCHFVCGYRVLFRINLHEKKNAEKRFSIFFRNDC